MTPLPFFEPALGRRLPMKSEGSLAGHSTDVKGDDALCSALRIRIRHSAVVEGLVEDLLLDALLPRHFAERAAARRGLLDDLARTVVADVRVQRRGGRERELGVVLGVLALGLDAVDALLGEEPRGAREELHRVEDVAGEERAEEVQPEMAL